MEYEIGTSRGRNTKVRPDSPLEGTGFEPSVPLLPFRDGGTKGGATYKV